MEGTVAVVSHQRWQVLLFTILLAVPGLADASERYLIIERPGKIVMYDRYQQILGAREALALGSFVPMRIVSPRTLLGDGLTTCMSVEFRGDTYYLLLDNAGRLDGEVEAGSVVRLEGSTVNDTVDVLRGDHLLFEPSGTSRSQFLPGGERLVRIFRYGARTYVMRPKARPSFGWVVFDNGKQNLSWVVTTAQLPEGSTVTGRIRENVRSKIIHANKVLLGLFAYFNLTKHSQRQAPQWVMVSGSDAITCTLQNTNRRDAFRESSRALAKELESVVLGSGLSVVIEPGIIVIRPK